jgi:hypothetical protein
MHRDIDAAMIDALIGLAAQTYQLANGPAPNNSHYAMRPVFAVADRASTGL